MSKTDILFEVRGRMGMVTLNRPKALNALTHDMALRLERQLDDWNGDDRVVLVVIRGTGDRAFCAGGDIRVLYDAGRPGGARGRNNFGFYADEYRLNAKIKRYPKPYVAIMDGIVMGGGVGVSIHGSFRVATERTLFAMPETGIGLFPDVGGTWFLPRLAGQTGLWLGLTGARLRGFDAVVAGVCDGLAAADDVDGLLAALSTAESAADVDAVLGGLRCAGDAVLAERPAIDAAFAGDSVEAVLENLAALGSDWATRQHAAIMSKSPACTRIAFRQIRTGATLSFEDCMKLEYRLARFCMTHGDFYEGVRATIIDKDGAPRWSPATLAGASEDFVAPAFALLGEEELDLGLA